MDIEEEVESILYIAREISVFKIPPLKVNEGHRATEWGDLGNPLWKGRLRISEKSSGVALLFEDAQNEQENVGQFCNVDREAEVTRLPVFARAEYDATRPCVEAVLDSSRYFVVRVEDAGKKAYIGLGFAERTDSFDFNVALQDYTKRVKANLNPSSSSEADTPSPHIPAGPKVDYSLKEGQTFSIAIPGRNKPSSTTASPNLLGSDASASSSGSSGGGFPLLPPPPSSGRRRA